jgi:hypothetical protein
MIGVKIGVMRGVEWTAFRAGGKRMRPTFLGVVSFAFCIASATSFVQQQAPAITGAQFDTVSIKDIGTSADERGGDALT